MRSPRVSSDVEAFTIRIIAIVKTFVNAARQASDRPNLFEGWEDQPRARGAVSGVRRGSPTHSWCWASNRDLIRTALPYQGLVHAIEAIESAFVRLGQVAETRSRRLGASK